MNQRGLTTAVLHIIALLTALMLWSPRARAGEITLKGTWGLLAKPTTLTIDFDAGTFRGEFSDDSSMDIFGGSTLKATFSGTYKGSKTAGDLEGIADYAETRTSKGIDRTGKAKTETKTDSGKLTFRAALKDGVITGNCYDGDQIHFGKFNFPLGTAVAADKPPSEDDVTLEKIKKLDECFQNSVREKIAAGYYVKNDGWFRSFKHMLQDRTRFAEKGIAGRCGEYGEWGMAWIRECAKKLFGDKTLITDIVMEEETTAAPEGKPKTLAWWDPDRLYESNHRATRVILPNGERFVLDYWEGVSSGNPKMLSEEEWIKLWRQRVGRMDYRISRSELEQSLKDLIKNNGEERGIALFKKLSSKAGSSDKEIELWIKSWGQKNWYLD